MRAEIRAKQRQIAEANRQADKWIQTERASRLEEKGEQQRERAVARKFAAEDKKEALAAYLREDTRVPRWYALGWHVKEDPREWRWPFSIDWSWVERGERVLNDERFQGLKLPPGFVKPSDRIMREAIAKRMAGPGSADRKTEARRPHSARAHVGRHVRV